MNGINFKFEGKYLVAEISDSDLIIDYQMEMITRAQINALLPVKKQMKNNRVYLYYEPVGKMPLDRLVIHSKMPDTAFLTFVRDTLSAVNELGDYQLSPQGLVMDKGHIFVHPAEYSPSFVYLPVYGGGEDISGVVNYLKNMLVSDMVDINNSGLMQRIISVLNSGKSASEMLRDLGAVGSGGEVYRQGVQPVPQPAPQVVSQPAPQVVPQPVPQVVSQPAPAATPTGDLTPSKPKQAHSKGLFGKAPAPVAEATPGRNDIPVPGMGGVAKPSSDVPVKPVSKDKKEKKAKEESAPVQEGAPDMKKIIPYLIGVSAVVILLFVAAASTGVFNDDEGNFDYVSLVAVPVFLVAADYFVYSKLKEKYVVTGEAQGTQKPPKAEKKKESGIVKRGQKEVFVPITEVKGSSTPVQNNMPPVQPVFNPNPAPQPVPQPKPYAQPQGEALHIPAFVDFGKTEVFTDDEMLNPYLLNRKGDRVDIKGNITRFGKLADQVDVVIINPKVSRIHADIIHRDGKLYVMDLNSANGTYINGNPERITGNIEYELHNNDRVVFANEEYTVHC